MQTTSHVPMTAPEQETQSNKRDNIELVPHGMHLVICTSVVDLGTQTSVYEGKENINRKLILTFEFPLHRQLFYESDTVPRPSVLSLDFNWMISKNQKTGKRTKLLEFLESIFGIITPEQQKTFDISTLVNRFYVATVQQYQKKDTSYASKIIAVAPHNPAQFPAEGVQRTNPLVVYSIAHHGFNSPAFASCQFWMRKQIKLSKEGIAHIQQGGKFSKFNDDNQLVEDTDVVAIPQASQTAQQHYQNSAYNSAAGTQQAPASNIPASPAVPQSPAPAQPIKTWLNSQFTYDQMVANGWSDEQLVANGYMKIEIPAPAPAAPPAPTPMPQAPMAPTAPAPMASSPATMFAEGTVAPTATSAIPQTPAPAAQSPAPLPASAPYNPAPGFNTGTASPGMFNKEEHDDLPF